MFKAERTQRYWCKMFKHLKVSGRTYESRASFKKGVGGQPGLVAHAYSPNYSGAFSKKTESFRPTWATQYQTITTILCIKPQFPPFKNGSGKSTEANQKEMRQEEAWRGRIQYGNTAQHFPKRPIHTEVPKDKDIPELLFALFRDSYWHMRRSFKK